MDKSTSSIIDTSVWQVYCHSEQKEKEIQVTTNYGPIMIIGIVTLIPVMIIVPLLGAFLNFLAAAVVFCAVYFVAWIIIIVCYMQTTVKGSMCAYIVDENNVVYEVFLSQGASSVNVINPVSNLNNRIISQQDAKQVDKIKKLFVKYKKGETMWNPIFGGEAKITCLSSLTLIKQTKKYNIYTYVNQKGYAKHKKIYNCFIRCQ